MSKKILVSIIAVLLVTGVAGFFIYNISQQYEQKQLEESKSQSREDEMESIRDLIDGEYEQEKIDISNWQIYRNEEMGFEVKIPQNFEAKDTSYTVEGLTTKEVTIKAKNSADCEKKNSEPGSCSITISYSDRFNSKRIPFRDHIESWKEAYNLEVESLKIDNVSAIILTKFVGYTTYFFDNSKFWSITTLAIDDKDILNNYPRILQTFRFIK